MAANIGSPLAVDQFIKDFLLLEIPPFRVVVVKIVGVIPGHQVNLLGDSLEVLGSRFELAVHHFQHARHGAEAVCMAIIQVGSHRSEALGIVNTDAKFLILIVHRALVRVAERQEADHDVAVVLGLANGVRMRVEGKVAVGQHDAFRRAGGTGSIDDAGHFVRVYLLDILCDNLFAGLAVLAAFFVEILEAEEAVGGIHEDHLHLAGHLLDHRNHLFIQVQVADHDDFRIGMVKNIAVFIRTEGAVHGYVDHVGQRYTHIQEVPLGAVVAKRDHFRALFIPQSQKTACHQVCILDVFIDTVFDPLALEFAGKDIITRGKFLQVFEVIENASNFHVKC